jgi:hypothetical protein
MGTRKVVLTGYGYWMRVFEQNRDLLGYEGSLKELGGQAVMNMDLDDENYGKLIGAKFMDNMNAPSQDNPGHHRVKFTRKWTDQFGGGAPEVLKADNNPWDFDTDGLIGNGSKIAVIVQVYDTKNKKIFGHRLEKIKVLEHVKYDSDGFGDIGADAVKPVVDVANGVSTAKTKPVPSKEELEDDVPF